MRLIPLAATSVLGTAVMAFPATAAHQHAATCPDFAGESQDMKARLAGNSKHHHTIKHMPRHDMPMKKS